MPSCFEDVEEQMPRPPHVLCAHCGQGWTEEANGHFLREDFEDRAGLSPYIGMTLRQVQEVWDRETNAVRRFVHLLVIRNPRWKSRDRDNARHSKSATDPITWEYVVGQDDTAQTNVYRFYHLDCDRVAGIERLAKRVADVAQTLQVILTNHGLTGVHLRRVPVTVRVLRGWQLWRGMGHPFVDTDEEEAIRRARAYVRVTCDQGAFGVLLWSQWMVDLKGTGVRAKALGDFVTRVHGLVGSSPELLRRFCRLLMAHSATNAMQPSPT